MDTAFQKAVLRSNVPQVWNTTSGNDVNWHVTANTVPATYTSASLIGGNK